MLQPLYDLGIRLYTWSIALASPFNAKAKAWSKGRKNWEGRLKEQMQSRTPAPLVWIHCASLGEFEQGRPVIEGLKERMPDHQILLTFFSPSGYELRKDYPLADFIAYLPADTRSNAGKFLDLTQPELIIFVKYEFWINFLEESFRRDIPVLLVSALFRPGQPFFRAWGKIFRKLLPRFERIFVQNESSAIMLKNLGLENHVVAGDTRIDRVGQIADQAPSYPLLERFTEGHEVLIAGSTWPADEELLVPLINRSSVEGYKYILAPHQIRESAIQRLEDEIELESIRYSRAEEADLHSARVLIIDNIGMLSSLYQYGHIAYIGGGFGAGIHNTLEPAAFGLPVIFGPKYEKFDEAVRLVKLGGAFPVTSSEELQSVFLKLAKSPEIYERASREARNFVKKNRGATQKILDYLESRFGPESSG